MASPSRSASARPTEARLARTAASASGLRSTKVTEAAPRDRASIPMRPGPGEQVGHQQALHPAQAEQDVEDRLADPVRGRPHGRAGGSRQAPTPELATDHTHPLQPTGRLRFPMVVRASGRWAPDSALEQELGLVVVDEDAQLVDQQRVAGQLGVLGHQLLGHGPGIDHQRLVARAAWPA